MTRKAFWILILAAALCLGWWQGGKAKASPGAVCGYRAACLATSCQTYPGKQTCGVQTSPFWGCTPTGNPNDTCCSSPTNGYICNGAPIGQPCYYFIPYCSP